MKSPAPKIDADVFDRAAQGCRFQDKSLAIARAILVDGETRAVVAKRFMVTQQHAGMVERRFLDLVQLLDVLKVSADDFIAATAPDTEAVLAPFHKELLKLRRKRYSMPQMVEFLHLNGVDVGLATLEQYFGKGKRHENTRASK